MKCEAEREGLGCTHTASGRVLQRGLPDYNACNEHIAEARAKGLAVEGEDSPELQRRIRLLDLDWWDE